MVISSLLGVAPGSLLIEEVLELDGLSSVHLRLLSVLSDDVVVVNNLGLEGVSPLSEGVSLGSEISELKESGLITEAEFAAKRQEVLDSL